MTCAEPRALMSTVAARPPGEGGAVPRQQAGSGAVPRQQAGSGAGTGSSGRATQPALGLLG
ncbi:MAG: hypothetical protein ACJ786_21850, partial [Catenulispora sp.]